MLRMALEFRSGLQLLKDQGLDDRLVGENQVRSGAGDPDRTEGLRTSKGRGKEGGGAGGLRALLFHLL